MGVYDGFLSKWARIIKQLSFSNSGIVKLNPSAATPEKMSGVLNNRIVWVDMEMTGLDINQDHILEIAALVTDGQLNLIAEGPNIVIHQPDDVLSSMNEWCTHQHGSSGLTDESRNSTVTLEEAERKLLSFVSYHVPQGKCPLAGSSVYMDRLFMRKYLPELDQYLHYRIIDVSTIGEICKRWYPDAYYISYINPPTHRAIDDIKMSLEKLRYFREKIFIGNPGFM